MLAKTTADDLTAFSISYALTVIGSIVCAAMIILFIFAQFFQSLHA